MERATESIVKSGHAKVNLHNSFGRELLSVCTFRRFSTSLSLDAIGGTVCLSLSTDRDFGLIDCEEGVLTVFITTHRDFMSLTRPAVDSILAQPGQGMAAHGHDRTISQAEQEEYEYDAPSSSRR